MRTSAGCMLYIRLIVRDSKPYVKFYSLCRLVITPVRERRYLVVGWNGDIIVSIHAPVRERLFFTRFCTYCFRFNSRSREGATKVI